MSTTHTGHRVDPTPLAPLALGPNQPLDRPYRGGAGIAAFRGTPQPSPFTPEDFVASTTEVFAGGGVGLTVLPDGRTLRDAVAADPVGYLGEEHARRHGADTGLLVKLLDTAERLFVHFHPDDAFAASALGRPRGKTEAWIVVDAAPDAYAALGFRRPVSRAEVLHWFDGQDSEAMLDAMNRVPLAVGDSLLVPAGLAHGIGPGVTLVELQQPTDLSVLIEYAGYNGLSAADALLGLTPEAAFAGLTTEPTDAAALERLRSRRDETFFPEQADRFFGAERIRLSGTNDVRTLDPSFSVLIVLGGDGTLSAEGAELELRRGATVMTAHASGPVELHGTLDVIRCRPPR